MMHLFLADVPHIPWVWLLVAYLWLIGGSGWVRAYEFSIQRPVTQPGRSLSLALWPVYMGVSIIGEWWAHLRPLFGRR